MLAHVQFKMVTSYVIKNKTKKNGDPTWDNRSWDKRTTQCTCMDRFTLYINPHVLCTLTLQSWQNHTAATRPSHNTFKLFVICYLFSFGLWCNIYRKWLKSRLSLCAQDTHRDCFPAVHLLQGLSLRMAWWDKIYNSDYILKIN